MPGGISDVVLTHLSKNLQFMTDDTTRTVTSADFFIKGAFPAGANFTFAHDDSLLRVSHLFDGVTLLQNCRFGL